MGRASGGGAWFVSLICAALAAPVAAGPSAEFAEAIARGQQSLQTPAAVRGGEPALISIILDDLGPAHGAGLRAADLPGAVACAFLPHTRFSAAHAALAHARGKEVLLHLPLQAGNAQPYPDALTLSSGRADMATYLESALASVPHARGVNNHQGSLLTEMPQHMGWLMAELKRYPQLYFVDSRTSADSVAYRVARARAVPAAERQIFLDTERGAAAVRAAFRRLVQHARRDGRALAIGHPYPETFKLLEQELPRLARYGVKLVPPSELIARQNPTRHPRYYKQLQLSPALNAAASAKLLVGRSAAAH